MGLSEIKWPRDQSQRQFIESLIWKKKTQKITHFSWDKNFMLLLSDFSSETCWPTHLLIELCSVCFDHFSSFRITKFECCSLNSHSPLPRERVNRRSRRSVPPCKNNLSSWLQSNVGLMQKVRKIKIEQGGEKKMKMIQFSPDSQLTH